MLTPPRIYVSPRGRAHPDARLAGMVAHMERLAVSLAPQPGTRGR